MYYHRMFITGGLSGPGNLKSLRCVRGDLCVCRVFILKAPESSPLRG